MRRFLGWMLAVWLCGAASGAAESPAPDPRLEEARADFEAASTLKAEGHYPEAQARAEHALALREAALGGRHPDVARCLNLLGELHRRRGDFAQAESVLQRALSIREEVLGAEHDDVASSLNSLASVQAAQGRFARAESLYLRAITVREAALGPVHPHLAGLLSNLALLYKNQGQYGRAEPLAQRALSIREATLGANHPDFADSLNNLAGLYSAQGKYAQAEPLYQRALTLREQALGANHPDVAASLNNLAGFYTDQGVYERAEPLLQRALALREATLGEQHPDVATSLDNLGLLSRLQGRYDRAGAFYRRALAVHRAALGEEHSEVADSLQGLADLAADEGDYEQAEPLYARAIALREATLGANHPDVAATLNSLALLYRSQGDYARAESLVLRALSVWKTALGERHRYVASGLGNLADLAVLQGRYGQAEDLYQRALALVERAPGTNPLETAAALDKSALFHLQQRSPARAGPLLRRALTLRRAALGEHHPDVATSLYNLAQFHAVRGDFGRAQPLFERALALREELFDEGHPEVAANLNALATLQLTWHRLGDALPLFTRAFALSEQRLRHEGLDFSAARLNSFLKLLREDEQTLYTLARAHPDDERVRRLALGAALLLKGRSLEETASVSRTLYRTLSPEDRELLERLRGLRTQVATLSLEGPGDLTPEEYKGRLARLTEQGNALEAELARRSAPFRALATLPSPAEIVTRVATALPRDAALVEFVAYAEQPLDIRLSPLAVRAPRPPRYLALVLLPDATTRAVDLGPAAPIDRAVSHLREALTRRDAAFLASAQALHQRVFAPLRPLLGPARRVLLAPDGQLGLVPFDALFDASQEGDGPRPLLDSFDFAYLTSGRQLLPPAEDGPAATSVVVLADPDFSARAGDSQHSRSLTRTDLSSDAWLPLPGTRAEAEGIQRRLPQAEVFLGPEATKERLLHLPPPGILHLATHGFFLEAAPGEPDTRGLAVSPGESSRKLLVRDPLLRSGLVFSGARAEAPDGGPSAGTPEAALVTALEMAGLDLWGTQLVVLSACDTGRGEASPGQGVLGLRHALAVAGAQTMVMSLWKVDDDSTRLLMDGYYRHLLSGQGRASALRESMRELRRVRPHPHDWAPFIALGSDAPLQGILPVPLATTALGPPAAAP